MMACAAEPQRTMVEASVEFVRAQMAANDKPSSRAAKADALAGHIPVAQTMSVEQCRIHFGFMVPWSKRANTNIHHPAVKSTTELQAVKHYQEEVTLKYQKEALENIKHKFNVVYSLAQLMVCLGHRLPI
jgi:hypothetical protein